MAEIAAALALQSRDGEAFLMAPEPPPERRRSDEHRDRPEKPRRMRTFTTYRIAVGKRHKIGPGAIVGAIANEGGLHRSDFGHIAIGPDFSLVELPAKLPRATLKKLERTRISGVLINLRPDSPSDKARGRDGGKPRRKPAG
jgi:ATP-dependent RNA helicase DeaD